MNIAIVDDDKTAARLLADKLNGFEEAHISGIAANGMDGLALVMDTNPDLLFLDIELPDISGIEFLERIADSAASDCRVVMYTAHQKFMLSAFRNQAFDYLMKPIDDQELRTIIRRVCLDMQMPKPVSPMRVALSDNAANAVTMCADGIGRRTDGSSLSIPMPWTSALWTFATSASLLISTVRECGRCTSQALTSPSD